MTMNFNEQLLLLVTMPLYLLVISAEVIISHWQLKNFYSYKETLNNIILSLTNSGLDLLCRSIYLLVLIYFYEYRILDLSFSPILYWGVLLLLEDLAFYTEHRMDHSTRFLWAVHVTHHSSQEYNLSTGFRSSVLQPLYRFIYFIPIAFLGFKPLDIVFMFSLTQIYGILVHTQYINKMPKWFEAVFVSPSHHRVHHACNIRYLDRNMGMVLIIWDKLFGTFQPEVANDLPRFGLTTQLGSAVSTVKIITHEWENMICDIQKPLPLKVKLNYIFKAPGWSHDESRKTSKQLREENGLS